MSFWKRLFANRRSKRSFSQRGEDLIIDFALTSMGITKPIYLDIGAHDPIYLSNTYYFYRKGGSGVCIEPLPGLYKILAKVRSRDTCLNSGVGAQTADQANFYVMQSSALSTFSKAHAQQYQDEEAQRIGSIERVPLIGIGEVLTKYFPTGLNLVSLDTEGMEVEILENFDFDNFRPEVFCVETLPYRRTTICEKPEEVSVLMRDRGYFLFADTFINSIFVDRSSWMGDRTSV